MNSADDAAAAGDAAPSDRADAEAVVLREMRRDDLPRILELEHQLFGAHAWSRTMLLDELGDPLTRWYIVAVEANQVIGYAGLAVLGDEGHVMTIGTDPLVQGRGLGRTLLRALLRQAEHRGAKQVILEVRVDNAAAIALYQSEGFVTVGVRKRYYQPENVDAAVMIRG